MEQKDLILQLRKFSREFDCVKNDLSDDVLDRCHENLLNKSRLIYVENNGELLGYTESWRINYEQFGRRLCGERLDLEKEDIQSGKICYINNVTIRPDARKGLTIKFMRNQFYLQNIDCEYVVGERNGKKHRPVIVLKMRDILAEKAINTEEMIHG